MYDDPLILNLDKLPNDKMLTEKHLAFLLGVSVSKLQKDRVAGVPPRFSKVRGAVRYRLGDIRAYIKDRTVSSTSEADQLHFGGTENGFPYARIGSVIYGFIDTLDCEIDEVLVGNVETFRSIGYEVSSGNVDTP
jgi:hypothetical protein